LRPIAIAMQDERAGQRAITDKRAATTGHRLGRSGKLSPLPENHIGQNQTGVIECKDEVSASLDKSAAERASRLPCSDNRPRSARSHRTERQLLAGVRIADPGWTTCDFITPCDQRLVTLSRHTHTY